MTIKLPEEVEVKLRERAAAEGRDPEAIAVEAVAARLGVATRARPLRERSYEEWSAALREWMASHPPLPHPADDSRDSIYEGRGE